MGVVYLARDGRLDRDVAVKELPEHLAADPDRLSRFEREAKVLASLNHPGIASIYGLEESGGRRYLVLEYVEGEPLSEVLKRGALRAGDAVEVAVEIARALEAAHEKGVVHRDLKPANIMITRAGGVKVLDFGLARQSADASSSSVLSPESPTLTSPVIAHSPTIAGVILGTAGYMSPEQARGRPVDKRSDIFSFGCVLYEMLTGARPFTGETLADVMGATLHKELDLSLLPSGTTAGVRRVLARCLAKDKRHRLHDIADARIELEAAEMEPAAEVTAPRSSFAALAGWAVAAMAIAGAAFLAWKGIERAPAPAGLAVTAEVPLPDGVRLSLNGSGPGVPQASPDGRWMVFTALTDAGGDEALYLNELSTGSMRRLEGTDGARYPFWSPDSKSIGYFAMGQLMRVEVAGGPPRALAQAGNGKGGTWTGDGRIVYSPTPGSALRIIPAAGGASEEFTAFGETGGVQENSHRHPFWIPGTDRVLYLKRTELGMQAGATSAISVRSLNGTGEESVVDAAGNAQFCDGHLFYMVGDTLVARAYDPRTNRFLSEPVPVIDDVLTIEAAQLSMFSVSLSGVLTCVRTDSGVRTFDLVSWDRETGVRAVVESSGVFSMMTLFDGGRKMLMRSAVTESASRSLFVRDMTTGRVQPIEAVLSSIAMPAVSADGTRMAYSSRHLSANGAVFVRSLAPFAEAEVVFPLSDGLLVNVDSWVDGDRALLTTRWGSRAVGDRAAVGMMRLDEDPVRIDPIQTPLTTIFGASLAPGGRWLALTGESAGDPAVFLMDLEQRQRVIQVSTSAALDPTWRADGRELYYRTREAVCVVDVELSESGELLSMSDPRDLLRAVALIGYLNRTYSVTPDGKTVYFFESTDSEVRDSVTILSDWRATAGVR